MTLSLYIARRFLWLYLRIFAGFFALMLAIDLIDELRRFADPGISFSEALVLSVMNVPQAIYRIMPLIMILSAIGLFMGLARSSELVAIRAAGRSGLRFLLAPTLTALGVGILSVAVLNPIVAATARRYDVLSAGHARGGSILSVSEGGLWLRQGNAAGQTVIQAARANLDGTELYDATFLSFDPDGKPLERIETVSAVLQPGAWALGAANRWNLTEDNPERQKSVQPSGGTFTTDLTPAKIRDGFGTPAAISIWDLPAYIASLRAAGFSARSHLVWLQSELALPLFLAAQVLIAAGFTMRHGRTQRTGLSVMVAMLCGFGVFFLRNFGRVLGENGQVPILAAAWTPPVATLMLALALLLHLEDG
jgi:lipopolysaccharide export system permease protein